MSRNRRTVGIANRDDIVRDIMGLPVGSRVTIQPPRRTNAQNALMWVLLECFADQVEHYGRKYPAETWKAVFMHALGQNIDFVPSLDGQEVVALGYRSSDMDAPEMSDMIELIYSEGARLGVDFHDAPRPPHDPSTVAFQQRRGLALAPKAHDK